MSNLIELAIPAFVLLMAAEALADALMRRDLYEFKDSAASVTMGLGNVAVNLVAKTMQLGIFGLIYRFRLFNLGYQWWVWLLLFFCDEFSYYWFHRASHECRLFWASHVVHHSSQRYNLSTALRQSWTGTFMGWVFWMWLPHVVHHSSQRYNLSTALRQSWTGTFMGWVFWMWLPLLGFRPMMVLTMQAISLLYQFWIHTELVRSMGPLEMVLNTPSHHRVHHGSNARYIDRNHAGTLIIWDRLFGTFEPEEASDAPVYGLTTNIHTYNPMRIAFHEWVDMWRDIRQASSWRDRFGYIFRHPGWKPVKVGLERTEETGASAVISG
jgi:sterol desaturase/sphingolipid hydroxylase (fatty acid hydroxylase superfamily)